MQESLSTLQCADLEVMQELALRTVGIFHYPKGSNPAEVAEHAAGFAAYFGKVTRTSIKFGSGSMPYAILNFETSTAAQAALAHKPKPLFKGLPVDPLPWRLPGHSQKAGSFGNELLT